MRNYYFRKEKITPTLWYRSQTVKDPSVVSSYISPCLININYHCALACDDVELQVYKILDCKPSIASASYHCENTHELLNHQGLEKNVRIRCIYAVFPAYCILLSVLHIRHCDIVYNKQQQIKQKYACLLILLATLYA